VVGLINSVPFGSRDVSRFGTEYLGVKDIVHLVKCCRSYRDWANKEVVIWKNASMYDKIPLVEGNGRNYHEDLKVIYPRISTIHGLFGRLVGPVPPISQESFRKFSSDDLCPFGEGKFSDNFVLFVDPSRITIESSSERPLALQDGKLIEVSPDKAVKETLTIDATFPNLIMLAKFPLKGEEHMPVVRIDKELLDALFEQSSFFPREVGVRIMKKTALDSTRNLSFDDQKAEIERQAPGLGYAAEDVRRRFLFDAERILTTGACPDAEKPRLTFVRGQETVAIGGNSYPLVVGGFLAGAGVDVAEGVSSSSYIAVVPGAPSEVLRPLELGNLASKECE